MAIEYLRRSEIDDKQWNYCIKHANPSLPYAYSFYLDAVSPEWSALITNNYTAVMPLPIRKKFLLQYVFQPAPCPQLGVFALQKLDTKQLTEFYQAIPSTIRYINYGVHYASFCKGFGQFTANDNYELDLNLPYEELLKNYKYNCRRSVKQSLRTQIQFEENVNPETIIELLKRAKQKQLNQKTSTQLVNLMRALIDEQIGFSIGIYNQQQQLCAAVFYIKIHNRIINLVNASNAIARKNEWMLTLIDQLIQKHAGKNIVFDFEGSNIPSIASFFKKFGAKKKTYYTWHWNRLPVGLRWLKSIQNTRLYPYI